MNIAILGAECTGKTQLAQALARALASRTSRTVWVPEVLRAWCTQHQRTPRSKEQLAIAQAQALAVETAAEADWLLADTTPLMTAIYSDLLFSDPSLYPFALEHHRCYDVTLVTGLDLPWISDGIQRDSVQVQHRVDTRLREVLQGASIPYTLVYGTGIGRLDCALQALQQHPKVSAPSTTSQSNKARVCEKCTDPDCEQQLFSRLTQRPSVRV